MDDAMLMSCGHSVGKGGLRRVLETVCVTLLPVLTWSSASLCWKCNHLQLYKSLEFFSEVFVDCLSCLLWIHKCKCRIVWYIRSMTLKFELHRMLFAECLHHMWSFLEDRDNDSKLWYLFSFEILIRFWIFAFLICVRICY